jgi:hypothetical protein
MGSELPPTYAPQWSEQDDIIEALYPAGHVEVYWATGTDAWGIYAQPRIPAGWELPHPTWPWGKFWDYPVVHAQGLGMILRRAEFTTCPWCVPSMRATTAYLGYVATEEVDLYREVVLEQYFGFRLRREDGWHLGWLRLRWHRVPGVGSGHCRRWSWWTGRCIRRRRRGWWWGSRRGRG